MDCGRPLSAGGRVRSSKAQPEPKSAAKLVQRSFSAQGHRYQQGDGNAMPTTYQRDTFITRMS